MNLDDLRLEWHAELARSGGISAPVVEDLRRDAAEIGRMVRLRDFSMSALLLIGALGAPVLRWLDGGAVGLMSRVGILAFAAASAIAIAALMRARRADVPDDWTMRARLEAEIGQLERQVRLGERVGWWLLGPMLPAVILLSLGGQHDRIGSYLPTPMLWAFFATTAAIYVLTRHLCRREARTSVGPLLSRLTSLHRDLMGQSSRETP